MIGETVSHYRVVEKIGDGGAVQSLFTVSLEHAVPGEYEMVMTFRDEMAGKTLELREPFTVAAPPGSVGAGGGAGTHSS